MTLLIFCKWSAIRTTWHYVPSRFDDINGRLLGNVLKYNVKLVKTVFSEKLIVYDYVCVIPSLDIEKKIKHSLVKSNEIRIQFFKSYEVA